MIFGIPETRFSGRAYALDTGGKVKNTDRLLRMLPGVFRELS